MIRISANRSQALILLSVLFAVLQLEIDNASELTEEYLYDELHPKVNINREQFSKPKGPGGRGPKRVTKD